MRRGSQRLRRLLPQRHASCRRPVSPKAWQSLQVSHAHTTHTQISQETDVKGRSNVSLSLSFVPSPSQGLCCRPNCEFQPAGQTCDEETDCQEESVCLGSSPDCPEPGAKENLTVCSLGTRVCLNGVRQP